MDATVISFDDARREILERASASTGQDLVPVSPNPRRTAIANLEAAIFQLENLYILVKMGKTSKSLPIITSIQEALEGAIPLLSD